MTAPVRSANWCQGTRFEWCSIVVTRISSPAPDVGVAPTAGHQVDAGGGAGGEDDFAGVLGADERADFFAGLFVLLGAAFAERVDAAVDVGVIALVHAAEHVDHLPRPLRAGGVVEEDERVIAVDGLLQDRESRRAAWAAAASTDQSLDKFRWLNRSCHEISIDLLTTEDTERTRRRAIVQCQNEK